MSAHVALAIGAVILLALLLTGSRAKPQQVVVRERGGLLFLAVLASAAFAVWRWRTGSPQPPAPAEPATRTVYVHTVTTHVVHSGMPGWGMVVIAVVALGVVCSLAWRRSQ